MTLRVCVGILAITLVFPHPTASFQSQAKRLMVGLVLSGGGARGLAHIGVLEWFKKNHLPVDYLTGTSMGGLVGGMYAMGMSPAGMRAFLKSINWRQAFSGGPTYEGLSYRRGKVYFAFGKFF